MEFAPISYWTRKSLPCGARLKISRVEAGPNRPWPPEGKIDGRAGYSPKWDRRQGEEEILTREG